MVHASNLSLALLIAFAPFFLCRANAQGVDTRVHEFIIQYCQKCHGPENPKADFRVDKLVVSQTEGDAENWRLVLDNLNLGEMPPQEEKQPTEVELEAVTSWIESELERAQFALSGQSEEVVLRRLNRTEYEYTIEDLFGVRGDFADGFPSDAKLNAFDNNGAALMLSSEQITEYLKAADYILDRSIQLRDRPKTNRSVFTLHDYNREAVKRHREQLENRLARFDELTNSEREQTLEMKKSLEANPYDGFSFPIWDGEALRVPTADDGQEVDAVIPMMASYAAPDTRRVFSARELGWYRFRILAYGIKTAGEPVRLKISYGSFRQGTIPKIADVLYLKESRPEEYEYRVYLQPNDIIKMEMIDGTNWARREDLVGLPGPFIAIREMEMEGPLYDQWPPVGHQTLLGDRAAKSLSEDEALIALRDFSRHLFRQPVNQQMIDEYKHFYHLVRKDNSIVDAFKLTAKAMMASPSFLYHVEFGSSLDAHAIANRLSYFLWRSCPDKELGELADSGQLLQSDVLASQVDRLLSDEKSKRFVNDFVGQWLGIQQIGDMQPDSHLYPEYDAELEAAMVGETRSFFQEMLNHDLPIINLIDSDWAMLNARIAGHYKIPNVDGNEFRRVKLDKADTVRGGILTHASILNITSNGTTTSPVVRGVWVAERLLGKRVPLPPPDVPAIEPDIRGATTIQEQLAKHRSIAQCAACHRKIDPYGFGLENFDVIGGYRENYRALEPTANPNRPKLVDGPKIDCSGNIPFHGNFDGFREFRARLLTDIGQVEQNVGRQLATFALGRTITYADTKSLNQIVQQTASKGGGLKTMIRTLITSDLFKKP